MISHFLDNYDVGYATERIKLYDTVNIEEIHDQQRALSAKNAILD